MIVRCEVWNLSYFNVDMLKRDDPKVAILQDFIKKSVLPQKKYTVTRSYRSEGTCLDLIMTNCSFVKEAGTTDDFISDHYTVLCIRKKIRENN